MQKSKEVIITAVVMALLSGIGYLVNDYINLKEAEVLRKERTILEDAYHKLDSIHNVEIVEREQYKIYVKKLVDSLLNETKANSQLTKDAIILIETNDFTITENERDSLYSILNSYSLPRKSEKSNP